MSEDDEHTLITPEYQKWTLRPSKPRSPEDDEHALRTPKVREQTLKTLLELRQLAEGLWHVEDGEITLGVGHREECLPALGRGASEGDGGVTTMHFPRQTHSTHVHMFACDPEGLALNGAFRWRFKWVPRHFTQSARWHWSDFTSNLWTYGMPHHNCYYYYCYYS